MNWEQRLDAFLTAPTINLVFDGDWFRFKTDTDRDLLKGLGCPEVFSTEEYDTVLNKVSAEGYALESVDQDTEVLNREVK